MEKNCFRFLKSLLVGLCISTLTFSQVLGDTYKAYEGSTNNKVLNKIDALVNKYKIQGTAIALIEDGKVSEYRNYGYANVKDKVPVKNKTVFKVASTSKTVTAYGIMKLVDEKKLDLDVPISKYLTKWNLPDSKYDENKVTLRTLLSHTAGITDSQETGYGNDLPSIEKALKMKNIHLKREPGTSFEYSSFAGLGICQLIIEEVTGKSFTDYMKEEVFEPLNMASANYDGKTNDNLVMASAYAGFNKETKTEPFVMIGAGGVNVNSEDFAKFVINLINYYNDGHTEMFKEQPNTKGTHGVYGLGIIPTTFENGKTIYHHNGTFTGWNAEFAFEPDSKDGIVILTNSDRGFYFTYEALGIWSENVAGGMTSDSNDVITMENGIKIAIIIVSILLGLLAVEFIYKLMKNKIVLVKGKKKIVGAAIRSSLLLILMIAWYLVFYTAVPVEVLSSMKDYYLFTFLTTNFQIFSGVLMAFLLALAVRTFYKKRGKEA